MKKIIVVALAAILVSANVSAQPRTLGARLNGKFGAGLEIAYQQCLGANSFMDYGLDIVAGTSEHPGLGMSITAVSDFIFAQSGMWNFYWGPGLSFSFLGSQDAAFIAPGICAQIGAEVNLFPHFAISFDWRPGLNLQLGTNTGFVGSFGDAGLGLRYRF